MAALTVVALLPFLLPPIPLSVDLPQHLASAALAGRPETQQIASSLWPRPYMGATYLLLLAQAALPPLWAGRLVLSMYAVLVVLAARALVDAAPSRDGRVAWLAPLFVSSWPLAYGFVPYAFGIPCLLAGIAAIRRYRDEPSRWIASQLAFLHVAALLFHPFAWALLIVASAPLYVDLVAAQRRRLLYAIALPVAAFALFASAAPSPEGPFVASDDHIHTWWRFSVKLKVFDYALTYLPGFVDHLTALPGMLALLAAIGLGLWHARADKDPIERAPLALLALYLVLPADLALGSMRASLLGPRVLAPLWLVSLVLVRGRVRGVLLGVAAASVIAYNALLTSTALDFAREWEAPLTRALAELPPHAKILPRVAAPAKPVLHPGLCGPLEGQLHALSIAHGADYDAWLFSTRQSPVRLRPSPVGFDTIWVQSSTPAITIVSVPTSTTPRAR